MAHSDKGVQASRDPKFFYDILERMFKFEKDIVNQLVLSSQLMSDKEFKEFALGEQKKNNDLSKYEKVALEQKRRFEEKKEMRKRFELLKD
jgi:hypothetical protein